MWHMIKNYTAYQEIEPKKAKKKSVTAKTKEEKQVISINRPTEFLILEFSPLVPSPILLIAQDQNNLLFFSLFALFCFWLHLWRVEFPGPRPEPEP